MNIYAYYLNIYKVKVLLESNSNYSKKGCMSIIDTCLCVLIFLLGIASIHIGHSFLSRKEDVMYG